MTNGESKVNVALLRWILDGEEKGVFEPVAAVAAMRQALSGEGT